VTGRRRSGRAGQAGQATVLLLGGLCAVLAGAFVLASVARGIGVRNDAQRAADIAALAGARAMHDAYPRLFEAPAIGGRPNPLHLEKAAYLALGRAAAAHAAQLNGAPRAEIAFPDGESIAPVRITVKINRRVEVKRGDAKAATTVVATAEAELGPGDQTVGLGAAGGGYDGPLAHRQGRPMRPDVALAFDRMASAARGDGVHLIIASGFRSDAEQAVLWARRPDPRWVAPPGKSLHRYATELDIGPPSAYGWLAANAPRFRFILRYDWEPWHR
jgi:hypothetical protein